MSARGARPADYAPDGPESRVRPHDGACLVPAPLRVSAPRGGKPGAGGGRPKRQRHARARPTSGAPPGKPGKPSASARPGKPDKPAASAIPGKPSPPDGPGHGASLKSLVRVISRAGLCSRKQAEKLVLERRVRVNGKLAKDPEVRIDERRDEVQVDDLPVGRAEPVYVLLHKPTGIVTTSSDERGRATVYDLLVDLVPWVSPVGRLDRDTSGLLLLTNDTLLADRVTDPRSHLSKVYRVLTRSPVDDRGLVALRAGLTLADGPTRPAKVRRVREGPRGSLLEITISEGRNRQVRRMIEAVGSRVRSLRRVSIGPLELSGLARGAWRDLSEPEVKALRDAVRPRGRVPKRGPGTRKR